jgi:hypothetical protein
MRRANVLANVMVNGFCVVLEKVYWHVCDDVLKKLKRYEEEEVNWKEKSEELIEPILECLTLLEKMVRVNELLDIRDELSDYVSYLGYLMLELDNEGRRKVLELVKEERKRLEIERKNNSGGSDS